MAIKQHLENIFSLLARLSCRRPWWFIAIAMCSLIFFTWQLQYLHFDATPESLLHEGDVQLERFSELKKTFGRNDDIIISFTSKQLFTPEVLQKLASLHQRLEREIPYVAAVNSLYNARYIYGVDDELNIEDFLEQLPQTQQQAEVLKHKALSYRLYQGLYVINDAKTGEIITSLFITPKERYERIDELSGEVGSELMTDFQLHDMLIAIDEVLASSLLPSEQVNISGMPVLNDQTILYMSRDMMIFISGSLIMIMLALYLVFRQATAVILPLLIVVCALIATMGVIGLSGEAIQLPTIIIPSFILAVGVGDAIHLLSLYFVQLSEGKGKNYAIEKALTHAGSPMLFTTLTTAAGLCSFLQSELVPISNVGWFAAVGIIFAFLYSVLLLPALLAVLPLKMLPRRQGRSSLLMTDHSWVDRFIDFSVYVSTTYPKRIVVFGLSLLIGSLLLASQLRFSHDPVKWLPDGSQVRHSLTFVDERLGGAIPIDLVIDSGAVDGIKSTQFMQRLDQLSHDLAELNINNIQASRTVSAVSLLKETHQALLDNRIENYAIADSDALIAQEFFLLEISDAKDLFILVDRDYQKIHLTLLMQWADSLAYIPYIDAVEETALNIFGDIATVQVTGVVVLLTRVLSHVIHSTAISYVLAFMVISLLMFVLLRSIRLGLVSIVVNSLPISLALAIMYLMGSPLDMFSMLIGSIAMGLAVDDTIHFMHRFQYEYELSGDAQAAISNTLHSTGRALLTTTMVLSAGFMIYLLSTMNNLTDFGFYTAISIVLALLSDFWLAPAFVILLKK